MSEKPKPPVQLGLFDPPAAEVKAKKDEFEFWKTHIPSIEEIDSTPELLAEFRRLAARARPDPPGLEDF